MSDTLIQRALAEGRSVLTEVESKQLVARAGIPVVESKLARTKAEAVALAREMGFPVALKIVSPDLIHKSDVGGVKLGLANATRVGAAYSEVVAAARRVEPDAAIHGVALQRMAPPGVEVIVGMSRDAQFGPVLMFGLGGVFVEVLQDVTFGIVPLLAVDARRMIREIKGAPLLQGHRATEPVDLAALESILLKLSDLVDRTPEIAEVDLNPIFAGRDGALAVDARVILASDAEASHPGRPEPAAPPALGFGERFPPDSIGIVGVSQKSAANAPGFTGMAFLQQLRRAGFEGRLYPINPKLDEIDGLKAYPSVTAVPEPLDLAILAIQARFVPAVLEECVAAHVANVHICTSGFGETGQEEGRLLEDRIREIAVRGGLRVIGPNCIGLHVPSARMRMFDQAEFLDGPVAFLSQSGGHALTFLRHGPDFGFGFSKVISYGNALTLDAPDFVEYLAHDADTQVICLYLEGVRDGRRLFELVREANPSKPVVVWKSGLTESGARAAASHTGSLAGDRQVWDAFFRQTGAIRVGSTEEMAAVAMTLLHPSRPRGHRAVVLSAGGGSNVATGDVCAQEGLVLPPLSARTRAALDEFVSSINQGLTNPMDVPGVLTDLPSLRRTLDLLVGDEDVDMILLHVAPPFFSGEGSGGQAAFQQLIAEVTRSVPGAKPIVIALEDSYRYPGSDECLREFRSAGVLAYGTMRGACRALRRVCDYHTGSIDSL